VFHTFIRKYNRAWSYCDLNNDENTYLIVFIRNQLNLDNLLLLQLNLSSRLFRKPNYKLFNIYSIEHFIWNFELFKQTNLTIGYRKNNSL